jgi:hypothetical protein
MNLKKIIAGTTMAGVLATGMPIAAAADGAASTRNIILGGALATYLIVQHNRKVHERYAEDASREATARRQANDANAAYGAERRAYLSQVAANADLKREIAYPHSVVVQQQRQLAMAGIHTTYAPQPVARTTYRKSGVAQRGAQVAMVSYGWGDI